MPSSNLMRSSQRIRPCYTSHVALTRRSISTASRSSVHIGTSFEHLAALTLRRFAFSLTRVGGARDRGIDLIGTWSPPSQDEASQSQLQQSLQDVPTQKFPVVVQCKSISRTVPAWVRELEGAVAGAPTYLGDRVFGMLVGKGKITSGILEVMNSSSKGLIWAQLVDEKRLETPYGRVEQMLWNRVVSEAVGDQLRPGIVYKAGKPRDVLVKESTLLWNGKPWEPHEIEKQPQTPD